MWSVEEMYHALLPKTDYRDKGRGHDRRLVGEGRVEAVMWNGLENVLKDEINLNSFKSALSLSWTRDCLEGVEIEFILVI